MNKYEKLFKDIYDLTIKGELDWKQISRAANCDIIFNPGFVYRQYKANLSKGGDDYKLLLIEKKYEDYESDIACERYFPELIVLDKDDELLFSMTEALIEKEDFAKLVDRVESINDRTKGLFA